MDVTSQDAGEKNECDTQGDAKKLNLAQIHTQRYHAGIEQHRVGDRVSFGKKMNQPIHFNKSNFRSRCKITHFIAQKIIFVQ